MTQHAIWLLCLLYIKIKSKEQAGQWHQQLQFASRPVGNLKKTKVDEPRENKSNYWDPADHITASSYSYRCSSNASNGAHASLWVATMEMESRLRMLVWARDHAAATRPGSPNASLLWRLAQRPAYTLAGDYSQSFFDFVDLKMHVLDALFHRAGVDALWRPGRRLLDVGCGHGFLAAYLQARFGVHIKGYDIANSYQCAEIMASPLKVHFFDGVTLPEPAASFDAVMFLSVLHHAANHTESLLRSASDIATRWILVVEDTDNGDTEIQVRNQRHDPTGIFRTDVGWKALFRQACEGFRLIGAGLLGARKQTTFRGRKLCTDVAPGDGPHPRFRRWYALERRVIAERHGGQRLAHASHKM